MTTNNGTPAAPDYSGPDYGMGDDNALAHEISSRDWRDAPRTHNLERMGWRGEAPALTISALPPHLAAPIQQQLAGLAPDQRAAREPAMVADAVRAAAEDSRITIGVGADATPLAKAQVNLAYRDRELERRIANWKIRLDEKTGYQPVIDRATGDIVRDPVTGEPKLAPIYAMSAGAREAGHAEMMELVRRLAVLRGPEGDRELDAALAETVALEKELREQVEDLNEIHRRGRELARDEVINRRAAAHARSIRSSFGQG